MSYTYTLYALYNITKDFQLFCCTGLRVLLMPIYIRTKMDTQKQNVFVTSLT